MAQIQGSSRSMSVMSAGDSGFSVPPGSPKMRAGAEASASGYGIPSNPMPSDTAPDDQAWAAPRRLPQPVKAFSTRLKP